MTFGHSKFLTMGNLLFSRMNKQFPKISRELRLIAKEKEKNIDENIFRVRQILTNRRRSG